jgi:hypothetical protein
MNKRQRKKKFKYILDHWKLMGIKETDTLVLKINHNKIKPDLANNFGKFIRERMPNQIIILLTGMDLEINNKLKSDF